MIEIVYEVDCHCGGTATSITLAVDQPDDDGIVSTTGGRQLTPYEAADPGKWVAVGVAAFTESVLRDRARYRHPGWVPPHPTDREVPA